MARREPSFVLNCDQQVSVTPNPSDPLFSQTGLLLRIRKFLVDDNGHVIVEDVREREFQEHLVLPEFMFGSNRHRNFVAHHLRQAGLCSSQPSLEIVLDSVFSDAKSILRKYEEEKNSQRKNSNDLEFLYIIPTITLQVKKYVRLADELEMVLQLSMQEAPKPVPATTESILALQKVKLLLELEDEDHQSLECTICMDQLSAATEVIRMPCSHLFHEDCIQKWLNTSHKCPLCRFPMPANASP